MSLKALNEHLTNISNQLKNILEDPPSLEQMDAETTNMFLELLRKCQSDVARIRRYLQKIKRL